MPTKPNHWGDLEAARQLAISRIMAILESPDSSNRDIGIAIKNLALVNRQNIDVDGPGEQDAELTVTIKEE